MKNNYEELGREINDHAGSFMEAIQKKLGTKKVMVTWAAYIDNPEGSVGGEAVGEVSPEELAMLSMSINGHTYALFRDLQE